VRCYPALVVGTATRIWRRYFSGHLNNILIEEKQDFHNKKDRILNIGLEVSAYINVDDTGARWGKRKLVPVPGWEGTK
jgi:hypothetical protein